ncbi:MAG: hypothetical protein HXX15_10755 [Rhodopseudomonas sp.]|uniref:hypothetical protein n=1 Tax=Rhodopseudomonas sp. TaxID=1078 RepID=UPI0018570BC9|nr:hypothetical protein [Rhodopseudomonas sp.]NVN86555.1 hypothetical protein [Rhodopseudomonas sp.]
MGSNRLGGGRHTIFDQGNIPHATVVAASSEAVSAKAAPPAAAAKSVSAASDYGCDTAGEMTLQGFIDHHGNESAPQKLVQLVGYRDPSRSAATGRPPRHEAK